MTESSAEICKQFEGKIFISDSQNKLQYFPFQIG